MQNSVLEQRPKYRTVSKEEKKSITFKNPVLLISNSLYVMPSIFSCLLFLYEAAIESKLRSLNLKNDSNNSF